MILLIKGLTGFSFSLSAKQLRAKTGRTMVALCVAGAYEVLQKHGASASAAGQKILPTAVGMVLADLRGKGLVRQRSLFADLIFCYFLIKQKVVALPQRLSGRMILVVHLVLECRYPLAKVNGNEFDPQHHCRPIYGTANKCCPPPVRNVRIPKRTDGQNNLP